MEPRTEPKHVTLSEEHSRGQGSLQVAYLGTGSDSFHCILTCLGGATVSVHRVQKEGAKKQLLNGLNIDGVQF